MVIHSDKKPEKQAPSPALIQAYWSANISLLIKLLSIWFLVSFGAGVIFADALNAITFMGFPLGFWFAQQGSIFVFVVLIFVYAHKMKNIERTYGISDDDETDSYDLEHHDLSDRGNE